MSSAKRRIEVDDATASALEARAAARGTSVASIVSELVARDDEAVSVRPAELAELDRRWERVRAGEETLSHDSVVRWLDTWGTPAGKSWRDG